MLTNSSFWQEGLIAVLFLDENLSGPHYFFGRTLCTHVLAEKI